MDRSAISITTTTASTTPVAPQASIPPARSKPVRALAPDLTRGAMLLLIAIANAVGVAFGGELSAEPHPVGLERVTNFVMFDVVHARAYPMFAILFGYGIVQLANRQAASGASPGRIRRILMRRNAWLIVFGGVHAALLYSGDFLGAYGLVGIVATLVLLRAGRWMERIGLLIWVITLLDVIVFAALTIAALARPQIAPHGLPVHPEASLSATSYASSLTDRVAEWPGHTLTVVPFIVIVWLGMIAARRRLLEDAGMHRGLLKTLAIAGTAIALLGGLPLALVSTGVLTADDGALHLMTTLHGASGMFGGIAYTAWFALLAARLEDHGATGGTWVRMLVALGRRSLSGYLFQSVAWLLLLAPFTLHLAQRSPSPLLAAFGIAIGVWLLSLVAAFRLGDRPAPAEKVLRRLTYGARSSS